MGTTTSGDANLAARYTLLTIASVILGGGSFVGGLVSPVGAVLGALTLSLAASLLTFLHVPSDWQIGAQGGILIAVLALQAGIAVLSRERNAGVRRLLASPALYGYVAAAVVWGITVAIGANGGALLSAALAFSSFAVLAALGQMLVITLGPGNIDLSIPSVVTLAGGLAMRVMDGQDAMIVPGLLPRWAAG